MILNYVVYDVYPIKETLIMLTIIKESHFIFKSQITIPNARLI